MKDFEELYEKIVKSGYDYGTGSWSVVTKDIIMKFDEYGEYIPYVVDGKSIDQKTLEQLMRCTPSLEFTENETQIGNKLFSKIDGIKFDSRLGYYSGLYAGHVVEGKYRSNGSSGGFGTWIIKELLEQKYIDGVIHVKESDDKDKLFEYQISSTLEDVLKGSKTKYYPVEFSAVLDTVKKVPGKYALVGVPSFIMSYHLLSENDPILKERILFTVGLICGHQKSAKFSEYLAWQCGIEPGDLQSINFRKKDKESKSDDYSIEVTGISNGNVITVEKKMSELDARDWGQGYFKVRSSDFTDDVMNETADITLGDAWLPEYTEDSNGNNVIIVRNLVIKNIIETAILEGKVALDILDKEKIFQSQAAHYRHTHDELAYRLYKKEKNNEWHPCKRVLPSKKITLTRKKIQDLREDICISSKENYRLAVEKKDMVFFEKQMEPIIEEYSKIYRIQSISNLGISGILKRIRYKLQSKL